MKTQFWKKNNEYFITSAILLALVFGFFAIFSVFPFGPNTIAHYDMSAQTVPLSELVWEYFGGKSSLFYTTTTGMGANIFGYLVYFLLSPFNLLTLIGGKGNAIYMVNIVFAIKLVTIACVICWFLKHYFPNLKKPWVIVFSLLYTFSGYCMMMYTYMSFLDYLILAPLFVHAFNIMKDKGNIWPLSIVLGLGILSCFSLGAFTMLYLMVIFGLYIFTMVEKEQRKKIIINTAVSCIIAIGLTSWLLVPAFIQFLSSSRNMGMAFLNTEFFIGLPSRIITTINEIICCLFAVQYLIRCDKKKPFNKFVLCLVIFITITIISSEVMAAFNGGYTFGYYSRFGFITALLTVSLASKYILTVQDGLPKRGESNAIVVISYLLTIVLAGLFLFCVISTCKTLSVPFANQACDWHQLASYMTILILLLLPIVIITCIKHRLGKHFTILMCACALVLVVGNLFVYFPAGVKTTQPYTDAAILIRNIEQTDRVKMCLSNHVNYSASIIGCSAVDTFSSLVDGKITSVMNKLGYSTTSNALQSFSGTLLGDIYVGNKYVLTDVEQNENYLTLIASENDYYLYENTLVGGKALLLDSLPELTNNQVQNQQAMFTSLGGVGEILELSAVDFELENMEYNEQTEKYERINRSECGYIRFENNCDENHLLYMYMDMTNIKNFIINDYGWKWNAFMQVQRGQNEIKTTNNIPKDCISFYSLDITKLSALSIDTAPVIENRNGFSVDVDVDSDKIVILPYINLGRYSLSINETQAAFRDDFNYFLTFDVHSGVSHIEIEYHEPNTKYLLIGLVVGLVLIGFGILLSKIGMKIHDGVVSIAFKLVVALFVTYFIIYPMIVMFSKCISSLFG